MATPGDEMEHQRASSRPPWTRQSLMKAGRIDEQKRNFEKKNAVHNGFYCIGSVSL